MGRDADFRGKTKGLRWMLHSACTCVQCVGSCDVTGGAHGPPAPSVSHIRCRTRAAVGKTSGGHMMKERCLRVAVSYLLLYDTEPLFFFFLKKFETKNRRF